MKTLEEMKLIAASSYSWPLDDGTDEWFFAGYEVKTGGEDFLDEWDQKFIRMMFKDIENYVFHAYKRKTGGERL